MRNRYIIPVIAVIFSITAMSVHAQNYTIDEIIENVRKQEVSIQDMQFNLKQVMQIKTMKEKQTVIGKVVTKKPDKLYVEYSSPYSQRIISNGKDIVIYMLGEDGVWNLIMKEKKDDLMGEKWMSDYGLLSTDYLNNYKLSIIKQDEDTCQLLLKPKDKSIGFSINIWINTKTWFPVKTLWEDEMQIITSTISKIKTNTNVEDTMFDIK